MRLPTPAAWPRTSLDGAILATFGPVPVSAGCAAYVVAQPVLVAVRDPGAYIDRVGGLGQTVRRGRWFRVRAASAPFFPSAAAVGVVRVARNRYAGARLDVSFDPECPGAAARASALDDALARIVRRVAVTLQLLPGR